MLIEKVPDLANLVFGSTFLGQLLTDRPFSVVLAIAGLIGWGGLVALAFAVAQE